MKREFCEKVLRAGSWDGKKYRYVAREKYNHHDQWVEIQRLPLQALDTTAALNDWETVYTFGKEESDNLRASYSRPACYKVRIGEYAVMVIKEDGVYECYLKKYTDDSLSPYPYLFMFGLSAEHNTPKKALAIAAENIDMCRCLFDEC